MAELTAAIRIRADDRAWKDLGKAARGSKKLEETLAARKELADFDRRDSAVQHLQKLQADLGRTATEFDKARKRTAELRRQIRDAAASTDALRRKFEEVQGKGSKLPSSHRKQCAELRSLRGAGVDTRRLGDFSGWENPPLLC